LGKRGSGKEDHQNQEPDSHRRGKVVLAGSIIDNHQAGTAGSTRRGILAG
jgi:hypothetical protein